MEGYSTKAGKTVSFDSLATEGLKSRRTDELVVQYEKLFVEVGARWIQSGVESEAKVAAFGRILPLAPYLAEHVEWFLTSTSQSAIIGPQVSTSSAISLPETDLCQVVLGAFRLLSFDCRSFAKYVRPSALESLFHHSSRSVRYLAVRTFCLYVHAADHATQELVKRNVGEGEVQGEWEGQSIDYRFLSLWEEKRWKDLRSRLNRGEETETLPTTAHQQLSPFTVGVAGILLPRLDGVPSREKPSELVSTPTTESNLTKIASRLLQSSSLLLTGLAGSGKTLLTRHFAWQLNKLDSMLLVGIWRPGVLTTADLDRAPNEVISTLLPLIERGELLIPNRGETVRAARGFRIIATMRSTLNPAGQQIVPRQNLIGLRFWNAITVQMPELSELERIISVKYPKLQKHVAGIMHAYARLLELYLDARFSSENGTSLRALTPRDLLKWCDRISMDDIFMEAFDCFAGSLRSEQSRAKRRDHLLRGREIKLEAPTKTTSSGTIRIGRARLPRHRISKRRTSGRPFSTNDYTLRLLEKVAVAVKTGTGKTTSFNLSQQSESGDLLGGYKPVNVRSLVIPLKDEFDDLFDTTFSRKKNQRFMEMLGKRFAKGEWKRMVEVARKAHESQTSSPDPEGGQPKKRRKKFAADLHDLEAQLANGSEAFAFSFLEGNIVKAVRNGDWVLLDEINLASSDTLEALADLLGSGPDGTPSILLTETGNVERVVAHPNFRVFAAMNPATDVGKKDLPPGIRSRFTELYVESPDSDRKSLQNIVEKYLKGDNHDPVIVKVAFDLAKANMLVDGADQKAHFSLRTLTRTLSYAREIAPLCSLRRALASEDLVAPLIKEHLFPQKPTDGRSYPHYIITPFVQRNMNNLIRASSTRRYPVLIQGPTSSGKTSMIEYLAKRSGNKFYLGSYISGSDGKLTFQEGILVKALREGHWIVLDELNLAPTDLLIPETQEVNPAGLYGGRKLHFDDIPVEELTEILHRRTMIPESWCKRINRLFEQKSFATLRDLFRWAQRKADTIQDLANNGYMLLAERKVIENVMSKKGPRVTIDEEGMYSNATSAEISLCQEKTGDNASVVWTKAMRRLFVLVAHAIRNNEPVLLVGETGCGKTTVCQMLADTFEKQLHILNAHQNTETGDLIGAQRPIRNRASIEELLHRQVTSVLRALPDNPDVNVPELALLLDTYDSLDQTLRDLIPIEQREEIQANRIKAAALFEWADGSLVHAMKTGQYFLLDEISLADDSVLERLNSVLESSRTLLLAEKGPIDSLVTASEGFQFLATMNPGGDYGKKELSPALRNRFTEIWVPALSDVEDILQIHAGSIVSFAQWFNEKYNTSIAASISIRDTLAWVTFINNSANEDPVFGIVHGAAMVFIDTLGANPAGLLAISSASIDEERKACLHRLSKLLGTDVSSLYFGAVDVISTSRSLQLGAFSIRRVAETTQEDISFSLEAPTTRTNAMRVVRALQLPKPILLEALAKVIGKPLTRLNLSEQTDLMDLFGSDVPVEGGQAGTFAWRDAPFLKAMKNGDWSVLEGLNAVLDHRGEVYISELDQTFHKHADFRVFAAQNPHHQGGGRKGLPASFVNRFTVVYADIFRPEDLSLICSKVFPSIEDNEVKKLINFVAELDEQVVNRRAFASEAFTGSARDFLDTVFSQRFRTEADRARLLNLFERVYGAHEPRITLHHDQSSKATQVGLGTLTRNLELTRADPASSVHISQLAPLEALMVSVRQNWPVILVGSPGSGKTMVLNQLASTVGASLVTFSMNADIDAMDLVGGYEQVDPSRELHRSLALLEDYVRRKIALSETQHPSLLRLLELLNDQSTLQVAHLLPLLKTLAAKDCAFQSVFYDLSDLLRTSQQIEGARFQWVDGILIQALEQGKWLVLDNANLCSSAVLDRLNSLLEPNGYLSINEHSTADGEARIVKPHPEFRIFMTMDPRFGELSRAMRNRAVEICLIPQQGAAAEEGLKVPEYPLDSAMYRFRHLCGTQGEEAAGVVEKLDSLSLADNDLLKSFRDQTSKGLVSFEDAGHTNGVTPSSSLQPNGASHKDTIDSLHGHIEYLLNGWIPQAESLSRIINKTDSSGNVPIPYHPLNSELVLHKSAPVNDLVIWYASLYDVVLDLFKMQQAIQVLPSTRLERRKEKQKLPAFLHALWKGLKQCVETVLSASQSGQAVDDSLPATKALRQLFWAFLELASSSSFDRATFQTYLKMLASTASSLAKGSAPTSLSLTQALSKEVAVFGSDVQLTTGLGMDYIWRAFKPDTSKTWGQLTTVLTLERLADRLDSVMWKSSLRFDEMIQIRERFASSLDLVRRQDVDATKLATHLEIAVRELEEQIGAEEVEITPYFEDEFEGLCQFLDLAESPIVRQDNSQSDVARLVRARALLLARRPTKAPSINEDSNACHLVRLYRHLGPGKQAGRGMALKGQFHTAMLSKLHGANEVQLVQLDRFESELQVLAQQLVLDCANITQNQYDALPAFYCSVLNSLTASHRVDIVEQLDHSTLRLYPDASVSEQHYRALLYVQECYKFVEPSSKVDARAWVKLGLAGLALYVPNYPHDPALRPMIERKLFNEEKGSLIAKLQALRQFQIGFTSQDTSFRIRQTEHELQTMGEEPPVPAIVRPEVSELDGLQGEFSNLLSVIQPLASGLMSIEEAANDNTLRQNIAHIIRRLEEGYRSYDDITAPAVGFLVCLSIGLTLGVKQEQDSDVSRSLAYIAHQTPFFGLHTEHSVPNSDVLLQFCNEQLGLKHAIDLRWHALHCLATIKTVDANHLAQDSTRQLLHNLFLSFYGNWKTKLLQDQHEQAKNTSLYTFKGEEEEADDEDPSLFPDYEKEDESQPPLSSTTREHAIRLANIHAEIFLGGGNPSDCIGALLDWCAAEMNRVAQGDAHGSKYEHALPAIYLSLEKKADALASSETEKGYNFYFDGNLPEAKRLITLIRRIQLRYRQIRNVWPEHATLWDVLRTCDEALEFRHVDPVAKFITKAEKLYDYMYEWQRVASREFSAANLFDDLTKLLVSWRQLELTTWARLFDIEIEKCRDNAKNWFFVAYETIIAATESIENEKDMKTHVKDLLKTMEGFFLSTTLGQYEQRIALLRQLQHHISMRIQDAETLKPVHLALGNFITYFSRLQKPVLEALAKGRQKLEKEVNDVIKLASWKDTNIEALKQSAKTSHHKLSKLVRKFRALLNQPVSGIVKAGFPEEGILNLEPHMEAIGTSVNPQALAICATAIPTWSTVPTRFKNLTVTVPMMRNLSSPPAEAIDGAIYITNFIIELEASIVELRKATPNLLNEENKETLYADTMKELRQMGIKSNLSSDVLARQDELSTVLATFPKVEGMESGKPAEFFLHKSLSLMSQVRDMAKEHSGDLTPNDRGMLTPTRKMVALVAGEQAKLGKTGDVDHVVRGMREWSVQLQGLVREFDSLPELPANERISDFGEVFKSWVEQYPISRTVLEHIEPYVFNYPQVDATSFSPENIFAALDMILGSMQDVEAALKDLPTSIDDTAWLISQAVETILDKMQLLHEDQDIRAIAALFATVQPIINQYLVSHKYLVDRCDALHFGTQGLCQPSEKSADKPSKDDKLESGTGLGEDDEDLEELAQEQKGEHMEGETGEAAEKEDQGNAVDEKIEGKEDVGTENKDEQEKSGEEGEQEDKEAGEDEEIEGEDQEENEEETLDLPDDLNMDGEEDEQEADASPDTVDDEIGPEQEGEEEKDTTGHQEDEEGPNNPEDEAREPKDDTADPNAEPGADQKEQTSASAANHGTLGQTAQPDAGDIADAHEDETQAQQIDKETQADTQALETAPMRPEDKVEEAQGSEQQDVDMEDAAPPSQDQEPPPQSTTEGQPQTFIGDQKPFSRDDDEDANMPDAENASESPSETSSLAEVDTQLELTHLDPSTAPTSDQARALWHAHESATHSLSLQLTESLRLILAPTLATKLRGDFRTGKRLNLKRIIPYIASGYKRDKIWLRRSMPSKRSYQVLIALDDSRSMREGGVADMGLKTLTLVTRSLAMLEVGEVSVVGFGDRINVAHEFDKPFTSEAGVKVFEQFGFGASKTDVRGLVERSLELFREARAKGSSSVGEDLWQLMLVVSDGICDSHAEIQRLVRKAQEERVMIVFVIIDSSATTAPVPIPTSTNTSSDTTAPQAEEQAKAKQKEKTSILDLTSVDISPEGKIVKWKYMERFPFRYYLVVRDVRELPGVLAAALRQWFGEVAGSA
ncbi:P-loop containing nucleoside triphosphate hydrolase protein [Byssothecium circinans]|uniref:Midasin n=1 Tax=Byssothecium circinans TaxID=147558 RepID=A0A6A5UAD2_9PLEO|nr:P-loop containing nucleoside triphosphate hydrolase protein [Byssothecium circinans]